MLNATTIHWLPRVLTPTTQTRLNLQNRVIRKLRTLGVRVLRIEFDRHLTIHVDPATAGAARRAAKSLWIARTPEVDTVHLTIDQVRVTYQEQREQVHAV
ncbi:hypothetical protein R0381_003616 [Jeongeupia wiesaeckerbachi]|uniref:hypothetical protein n=1 Tax=Jeongeupia wiesaeckerbachi TaxID=3051218 RepID=UPI003D801F75